MANLEIKKNDKVVYPAHGVGEVIGIESRNVAGKDVEFYVVSFLKDKMTLRIPVARAKESGLRALCGLDVLGQVRTTLRSRARINRGMWSRRAKEYESKINSGNIISLAEVVRDLHKNIDDPDRSYSERVIYENALGRLAGEVAAVEKVDVETATNKLVETLRKVKEAA